MLKKFLKITKYLGLFLFFPLIVFVPIYFAGHIDIWGYEKDLEQRVPFSKYEQIVYGGYNKNVIKFKTNYDTELIYTFPENTPQQAIVDFTKNNVGQQAEIRIENIQSAYLKVFNIKVQ